MSGVLYLADVLQLVVDGLDDRPFPEQYLVIEVHQRVLHVPLDLGYEVYVVDEEHLKEILADVPPVCEEFPEEPLGKPPVLQGFPVIGVSRRELPLDDLAFVIDDQVELEPIEPSHCALPLGRPPLHRLVLPLPLDVAGDQGRGVDDGNARALAKGAGLQEYQQVDAYLRLTLHEAVIGYGMGEFLAHVLADISQVERLQVTETVGVEQDEDGHDLTVGHPAGTVTMPLARFMKCMFFQLWGEIFAEFVENTENFY